MVTNASWWGGGGNTIVINHGSGVTTIYMHLERINVSVGQSVNRGDIIGIKGTTGASTGIHLHFEIRINNSPIDPLPVLRAAN